MVRPDLMRRASDSSALAKKKKKDISFYTNIIESDSQLFSSGGCLVFGLPRVLIMVQKLTMLTENCCGFLQFLLIYIGSRDSSVGIETDYGLDFWGSIPGRGKIFFFTPQRPDRLWGPPSLLSNGYRGIFPRGLCGRSVKLTTHLHLVPR
jgi:hypothetical protein